MRRWRFQLQSRTIRRVAQGLAVFYTLFAAAFCFPALWLIGRTSARSAPLCLILGAAVSIVNVALVWVQFTRDGRRQRKVSERQDFLGTLTSLIILVAISTMAFSYLGAAIYLSGIGGLDATPTELASSRAFDASYIAYLWHLADVVPVLKLPETLDWKLAHKPTGCAQGLLVLAYTAVVVAPLIDTIARYVKRLIGEDLPANDVDRASRLAGRAE